MVMVEAVALLRWSSKSKGGNLLLLAWSMEQQKWLEIKPAMPPLLLGDRCCRWRWVMVKLMEGDVRLAGYGEDEDDLAWAVGRWFLGGEAGGARLAGDALLGDGKRWRRKVRDGDGGCGCSSSVVVEKQRRQPPPSRLVDGAAEVVGDKTGDAPPSPR
ncbi:hypothetical protein Dimus_036947 [Dionaea muscipula]